MQECLIYAWNNLGIGHMSTSGMNIMNWGNVDHWSESQGEADINIHNN